MRSITVNGNTYNSISAAWRAESPPGLAQITVRTRLNAGWTIELAFWRDPIPAQLRRTYRQIREQ